MDALKKFLVLLTSFLIIGLVVYLITISSPSNLQLSDIPPRGMPEDTIDIKPEPIPEDTLYSEQNELFERPVPKRLPPEEPLNDSIDWKSVPENLQTVPEEVPVQGAFPYGNPNPVFINATNRILPAVVTIMSTRKIRWIPHDFQNDKEEEPQDEFFHPGSGSGILISDNGYVLTNYHVVEKAKEIRVKLFDKREFYARFIGGDPTTDIAVLKIESGELPTAFIGNSDSIQIGEWVMAVGNPLNFTSTVTAGIISAIGRDINIIDEKYQYRIENFIQTDAVINPGNSGGALVNLKGEVIGINTAIATRTGLNQGYGFAIPINLARKVVDDILKFGYVKRALLGVTITPVDDRVARGVGLPKPMGALIQGVQEGFPAAKTGLQQEDIILAVDGEEVQSVNDLQIKIARRHPGEKVNLSVWRNGRKIQVSVVLAEAPVTPASVEAEVPNSHLKFENLGLNVRELKKEEHTIFDVKDGVLIENVQPGSPASIAGLFRNEVILSINEKPVKTQKDFNRQLKNAKEGDILKIKVRRLLEENDTMERIVFVEVP